MVRRYSATRGGCPGHYGAACNDDDNDRAACTDDYDDRAVWHDNDHDRAACNNCSGDRHRKHHH
jgi:hypothetical protein